MAASSPTTWAKRFRGCSWPTRSRITTACSSSCPRPSSGRGTRTRPGSFRTEICACSTARRASARLIASLHSWPARTGSSSRTSTPVPCARLPAPPRAHRPARLRRGGRHQELQSHQSRVHPPVPRRQDPPADGHACGPVASRSLVPARPVRARAGWARSRGAVGALGRAALGGVV
jgi:hypothetical protein